MAEGESRALRVGISACLLGERVRHDGGHRRHAFLTEVLAKHVEWVPVCPEVELGLGVPRAPINLVRGEGGVRLVVATTGEDLTARMQAHAAWRARSLGPLDLDGYVLKSASPSCGLAGVRVLGEDGVAEAAGRGLFAQALADEMPLLALEESARLARPARRRHFLERLAARARWRAFLKRGPRAGELAEFHAAHKYALLARSPEHHARLTRLVTRAGQRRAADVLDEYGATLMRAMAVPATRARHLAVLAQLAGFFERALDHAERAELAAAIARYRRRDVTLGAPLGLVREHVRRLGVAHLAEQVYLDSGETALLS
jgi:uncharacterized protein YbbK (DUF523 family)/uncharacterized protein YbgA (DUF1722 family)